MSTKPILFSTTMVRAILDGRKTMTRRVIKPQTVTHNTPGGMMVESLDDFMHRNKEDFELLVACAAPYQPGDILWVRETWREYCVRRQSDSKNHYCYKADHERGYVCFNGSCDLRWRPSIFMPKEAARIFLRVTDVRAERVRDMYNHPHDALLEGMFPPVIARDDFEPVAMFHELWDSINAKRGYGWDTNPWVWVYSFKRVDKPAGWPGGEAGG